MLPSLTVKYHYKLFEHLSVFHNSLLLGNLFISVLAYGYLFCTLNYNLILLDLFSCSDCSILSHWELLLWVPMPF